MTGIDYVGPLLERAGERAAVEGLTVAFRHGDAEALPFRGASFDAVVSVVGSMFAPNHRRTAAELVRVTRPGGTIALASWTPEGFVGSMFGTIAAYVPPPAGLASPMLWGVEGYLEELFGPTWSGVHRRTHVHVPLRLRGGVRRALRHHYGPTRRPSRRPAPIAPSSWRDLGELALMWNRLEEDGPIAVPATYLESVGVTRAWAH